MSALRARFPGLDHFSDEQVVRLHNLLNRLTDEQEALLAEALERGQREGWTLEQSLAWGLTENQRRKGRTDD